MKISIKKYDIREILILLIVAFIPFTSIRIIGFKISELLTMVLIGCSMNFFQHLKSEDKILYFVIAFSFVIIISACFSSIDPLNHYCKGINSGIYYSFELGWFFRIVRLLIVFCFTLIVKEKINKNINFNKHILDAYICSCLIVGIYGICEMFQRGLFIVGISRTALMAVEPSEAGFINIFGLIISIFLFVQYKRKRYLTYSIMLVGIQLVIGSTTSLLAGGTAITISYLDYIRKGNTNFFKKIFIYIMVGLASITGAYYISTKTHILDKLLNYQYYLTVHGSSVAERLATITTCWKMFLTRPILGVGLGNFGWYLSHFVTSIYLNYIPGGKFQPNNLYFELLAEVGIIGFLIYVAFIIQLWKKINLNSKREKNRGYWNMLLAMLLYLMIHNMTLTTLFSFQFWLLIAFIFSIGSKKGNKHT